MKLLDKEIQVFLGIPYAKPPVGTLRFMKPQAPQPWQGVYDATYAKDSCVQPPYPGLFDIPTEISEDCLYLNVWTSLASTRQGFPVLVWFHGGMHQVGSAYEARYNGSALAALNDVVVVSCNFRLSVLGFLYLNHTLTPGNLALWDQRAALQWVQRNIEEFGGDPDRVTVFGESSGAVQLHGHILSPHSRGLFHRVFLMSGSMSIYPCESAASENIAGVNTISEAVGCGSYERATDPGELLDCLRDMSAQDVGTVKAVKFRVTCENEFIPCRPSLAMKEGWFGKYDAMANYSDKDREFSADAMNMLASFARSGKPSLPDGKEFPKFTPENRDFMWLEAGNYTIV
ncbi:putative inactive carboxylesterase 4 [Rhipicephalus sanguineus]|uniref:putative inactive carboxylesterase 4 n=1 Tax=Rhipicephalus sanguineus TaxID=34632 RepID=UPI0018953ED4|nr:putative inactive carboxylesterase 4 [Rhipicephalus sanguineus]